MGIVEGLIEPESEGWDPLEQGLFPLAFLCGQ
jgi:hypothetical protein